MIQKHADIIRSSTPPAELYALTHHFYEDIRSQLSFVKLFGWLDGKPCPSADDISLYFSICPLFRTFPWLDIPHLASFELLSKLRPEFDGGFRLASPNTVEVLDWGPSHRIYCIS
ncbi:hypothetical protein LTR93_011134 [Exophiala xenobiotica]|nr:hypothetical protein LTR93_011134 [Exophiala xenobiotica]